jgi:hypothetical protein
MMDINEAINIVKAFKKESVKEVLLELQKTDITNSTYDFENIFTSAKIIKEASAQIDEIVHASGIMLELSVWLNENEDVKYLSLGAGNHKEHFDLETNHRIAEFKFGKWNENSANGIRRRGYFSNYITLLTADNGLNKYFVIEDKNAFLKFLNGTASWRNVLSKNPSVFKKLEKFLVNNKMEHIATVGEIYHLFNDKVAIVDYTEILKEKK